MRRLFMLGLLVLAASLAASHAAAERVTVTLNNGRTIQGELLSQTADEVVLDISGIKTPLQRDLIREMQVDTTIEQQYAQRLSQVDPRDVQARMGIAAFLYNERAYKLAERELLEILKVKPNDESAQRLLAATRAWLAQIEKDKADDADDTPTVRLPIIDEPTDRLTDEDINWIRLYEYSFADRLKPRVVVPREVINFMYERYADSDLVPKGVAARRSFLKKQGFEQLDLLFRLNDRNLWGHAIVRGDPEAMRTFRQRIHNTYVLSYCGAANCHGDPSTGGIHLLRDRANTDETVYTNFYVLDQYRNDSGYMIDRDAPNRSLLVQYGLPHAAARVRHPDVGGWKPNPAMVRGQNTPLYKTLIEWMGRELYKPAPRYEEVIDFDIPGAEDDAPGNAPAPRDAAPPDGADDGANAPPPDGQ